MKRILTLTMAGALMVTLSGSMLFWTGCPAGVFGGNPFTALLYGNGPFGSPGIFNLFVAGGSAYVYCCDFDDDYYDDRGSDECGRLTVAECDMYEGFIVSDCDECWDRYSDRTMAAGSIAVTGLERDVDITLEGPNRGVAYFHPEGYTVIGAVDDAWSHTVQIVVPHADAGEFAVADTDGQSVEPTIILRDADGAFYGTLNGSGAELGKVVIDGDYPEIGETMTVRFSATLADESGRSIEIKGDVEVPFRTMPEWATAS